METHICNDRIIHLIKMYLPSNALADKVLNSAFMYNYQIFLLRGSKFAVTFSFDSNTHNNPGNGLEI